jgi:hypothetical protein
VFRYIDGNWYWESEGTSTSVTDPDILAALSDFQSNNKVQVSLAAMKAYALPPDPPEPGAGTPNTVERTTLEELAAEAGIPVPPRTITNEDGVEKPNWQYFEQLKDFFDAVATRRSLDQGARSVLLPNGDEVIVIPGITTAIFPEKVDRGFSVAWREDLNRFIVIGPNGTLEMVEPEGEPGIPFTTPIEGTDHVVYTDAQGRSTVIPQSQADDPAFQLGDPIESGGFRFIETSLGHFSFLPREGTIERDPISGRLKVTQPDGHISFLSEEQEASVVEDPTTGLFKVTQPDGSISFLTTPGKATVVEDPVTGRFKITQPDGEISFLSKEQAASVTVDPVSGRFMVTQPDGTISFLAEKTETFDPGFIDEDRGLFQQRSGTVSQFAGPQIDDMITQALIDGEYEKAFSFQDFRDRPSAESELKLRLQFARSPADQQIISEIARGATTVQQAFDPGSPRRIGSQPDFLVEAYNDFLSRTQLGRPPTQDEGATLLERLRTGRSPETEALQSEVEALKQQALKTKKEQDAREISFGQQMEAQNLTFREQRAQDKEVADKAAAVDTIAVPATAAKSVALPSLSSSLDLSRFVSGDTGTTTARDLANPAVRGILEGVAAARGGLLDPLPEIELSPGGRAAVESARSQGYPIPSNFDPGAFGGIDDVTGELARLGSDDPNVPAFLRTKTSKVPIPTPMGDNGLDRDNGLDIVGSFFRPRGVQGLAKGGIAGKNLEMVGEEGPELVDLPAGTRVTPMKNLSKAEVGSLKKRGVKGYQTGGIVFPGANNLPIGLRQLQSGRGIGPTRGRLLRAANLRLPSQQALQNLTPESVSIFMDLAAQAGIPPGALAQEIGSTAPAGARLPIGRRRPLPLAGIR